MIQKLSQECKSQKHNVEYDIAIIGAGSGGVRFAKLAGGYGLKVVIFEEQKIGGTCVLRGCVPKKLLYYAAKIGAILKLSNDFSWENVGNSTFNLHKFIQQKEVELNRLSKLYEQALTNNNVEIVRSRATLIDKNTIACVDNTSEKKQYRAKKIVLATGSKSRLPTFKGVEFVLDSEKFLNLQTLPQEILVLGGGYIAMEFIGILRGFSVKIHNVLRSGKILNNFDSDVANHLKQELVNYGINFIENTEVLSITKEQNKYLVKFKNQETLTVDLVISAIGREPNLAGLHLENTKVTVQNGFIETNAYLQTKEPNIYALGDIMHQQMLTPVAIYEAKCLFETLCKDKITIPNYDFIPTAVFSMPELATCGLSEVEARMKYTQIEVFTSTVKSMQYSFTHNPLKTLLKIIVNKADNKIVGLHLCANDAAEIIQGFAVALKQGITKEDLNQCIGLHPTVAEDILTL